MNLRDEMLGRSADTESRSPLAQMRKRMLEDQAQELLKATEKKKQELLDVQIALARKQLDGKPTSRRPRRKKSPRALARAVLIRRAIKTGRTGTAYCALLDKYGLKIPSRWIEDGCPKTHVDAYRKGDPWKHRIDVEKSRVKAH